MGERFGQYSSSPEAADATTGASPPTMEQYYGPEVPVVGPRSRSFGAVGGAAMVASGAAAEAPVRMGRKHLMLDTSWQEFANCLGVDPDLFFPEKGASTREAKEVCRGCVVRPDCLEFALANGEKFGIWGGMSERERRRIRRRRALERQGLAPVAVTGESQ